MFNNHLAFTDSEQTEHLYENNASMAGKELAMTGLQSSTIKQSLLQLGRGQGNGEEDQGTYSVLSATYSKVKDKKNGGCNGETLDGYSKLNYRQF